MEPLSHYTSSTTRITKYTIVVILLWTILIGLSAIQNWRGENHAIIHTAKMSARRVIEQDLLFRRWNTSHGGVFVPLTNDTPANPYLEFMEDHVLTTTTGKKLTLLNPAYMTRQVQELQASSSDVKGHITSLNPIRPENSPTEWEKVALEAFEDGATKYGRVIMIDSVEHYFMMKPLITEHGCLTCHADQGYQEGDIRGGLSAAIPLQPFRELKKHHLSSLIISHSMLYLFGMMGIGFASVRIRKQTIKKVKAERAILKKQFYLEKAQELGKIGTWELDLVSNILTWTDENCRIFGVPPGTVATYEIFINKVHPEDRDYVNDEWEAAVAGKPYQVEHRLLIGDVTKWVRQEADMTFGPDGIAKFAIGFTQDITAQKISSQAVLEGEERFRDLFEKAPISYQSLDESGDIIEVNETFCLLLGYSREEVLNRNFSEFLDTTGLQTFKQNFPKFKRRGYVSQVPFRMKKKDGTFIDILLDGKIGHNDDGSFKQTHCVFQDVTEKLKMEESLRLAELQYKELVERSSNIVTRVDLDGILLYVNQVSEKIYGLPPEECIGKNAIDFVYPEDQKATREWFVDWVNSEGLHATFENRQINVKTGEVSWILWTADIELDAHGKPFLLNSIGRDITERKLIELKLQESEAQFRMVMQQSPNVLEIYDLDGLQIEVNKAYEELWDFPASTTMNKFNILKSQEVVDTGLITFIQKAYAGESVNVGEYKFDPSGDTEAGGPGRERWLSTRIYPLKDFSGKVRNIVITHEDITSKREAENRVAESEQRYRSLFETSIDGICSFDANRNFTDANDAARNILGYSQEELLKLNLNDIVFHEDQEKSEETQEKLRADGFYEGYQGRVVSKDGQTRYVEVSSIAIYKDGIYNGSHDIVRDVTEKIRLDRKHQVVEDQLRQSQKLEAVGTMVGGIAHELNNVLQSMFLYGGLIRSELPPGHELHEHMDHMLNDGERAREIVKQILTFSRKSKVELLPHHLHNLIEEALSIERASIPPNIQIQTDIDHTCGPVMCDKIHIHQIIINLCNNAHHAMAETGGSIFVSLKKVSATPLGRDKEEALVELVVRDTGQGMDAETLEKIFDPFFTTKSVGEGTGLGLSVVHGIVEMMNGELTTQTDVGKGTTFRILWPQVDISEEAVTQSTGASFIVDHDKSILMVEDEEHIRSATQNVLEEAGFSVDTAEDGQRALALFKTNPNKYDLIITDQSMPKFSGIELTNEVRKSGSEIPILMSSGQLGMEDIKGYKKSGITTFIQKPWTARELIKEIESLFETQASK